MRQNTHADNRILSIARFEIGGSQPRNFALDTIHCAPKEASVIVLDENGGDRA